MNLEVFTKRLQDIEQGLVNLTNQYQTLTGHKAEVQHWISELVKDSEETKVVEPVASLEEAPVE